MLLPDGEAVCSVEGADCKRVEEAFPDGLGPRAHLVLILVAENVEREPVGHNVGEEVAHLAT